MIIEVIASTFNDCIEISESKAHRIELVSALEVGGLTPSYGLIRKCVEAAGETPINVMIRPHSHSFQYSKEELEIMRDDIRVCRDLKVNGVVLGPLLHDKTIDTVGLQYLLEEIGNLQVTFHKAFDQTPCLLTSLATLKNYKQITTILTQGGTLPITSNIPILQKLIQQKSDKIILLGGGLNATNMPTLSAHFTTDCQYHFGTAMRNPHNVCRTKINDIINKFNC